MKKSIIYISSLLLASCAHASLQFPQDSDTPGQGTRKHWSGEENELLLQLIAQHGTGNWDAIAQQFQGRTARQVCERWHNVLDPALVKGNWTEEEDAIITQWVQQNGPTKWADLAKQLPGRIGKQCRERWTNRLDPAVSQADWTPEEDTIIIRLHAQWGNKWATIASMMPFGRTGDQVKNRWNSTLSKQPATLRQPASLRRRVTLRRPPAFSCPATLPPPATLQQPAPPPPPPATLRRRVTLRRPPALPQRATLPPPPAFSCPATLPPPATLQQPAPPPPPPAAIGNPTGEERTFWQPQSFSDYGLYDPPGDHDPDDSFGFDL
jgi:hypothetical protein